MHKHVHLPKPTQAFIHGVANFRQSTLVHYQWGNDHALAVEVIQQRKYHVKEKSSTAFKAQVRMALLTALIVFSDKDNKPYVLFPASSVLQD